jgi:hypothetical protein
MRTVFFYQDPEWTFLVTRASRHHFLHERFSIVCVARLDSILSNKRTSAHRVGPLSFVRTFYLLWADLCPSHVHRFHSLETNWTVLLTRASRADHSLRERMFFYCLRGTRGQHSIQHMDRCPPRAELFSVMSGPLSLARGLFSFIRTPSGHFCSLALRMRAIPYASGPISIACVAHIDRFQ